MRTRAGTVCVSRCALLPRGETKRGEAKEPVGDAYDVISRSWNFSTMSPRVSDHLGRQNGRSIRPQADLRPALAPSQSFQARVSAHASLRH